MIVNIVTKNYSTGAKLFNWLLKITLGRGFIKENTE